MKKILFLVIAWALLFTSPSMATTIAVDDYNAGYGTLSNWYAGQTFTIESGWDTRLDTIELKLGSSQVNGNVTVSVYEWNGSQPIGGALVSDTVAYIGQYSGYFSYTFDLEYNLTDNTQYFFAVTAADGATNLGITNGSSYTGGEMYSQSKYATSWGLYTSGTDIDFTMELSEYQGPGPDPVPEPATLLLFGLGILGLARVSRKNHKN